MFQTTYLAKGRPLGGPFDLKFYTPVDRDVDKIQWQFFITEEILFEDVSKRRPLRET